MSQRGAPRTEQRTLRPPHGAQVTAPSHALAHRWLDLHSSLHPAMMRCAPRRRTLWGLLARPSVRPPPGVRDPARRGPRLRDRCGLGGVRSQPDRRPPALASLRGPGRGDRAAAGPGARARAAPERARPDLSLASRAALGVARAAADPGSAVRAARGRQRDRRAAGERVDGAVPDAAADEEGRLAGRAPARAVSWQARSHQLCWRRRARGEFAEVAGGSRRAAPATRARPGARRGAARDRGEPISWHGRRGSYDPRAPIRAPPARGADRDAHVAPSSRAVTTHRGPSQRRAGYSCT